MDLQMPDLNGIDAIVTIRKEQPQARIIVLTTYEGDVLARRALKAGAAGYTLKDLIRTELLDAIRAVYAGRRYIPQKIVAEHYAEDDLSQREIEVLRQVARGTSNKIIASQIEPMRSTLLRPAVFLCSGDTAADSPSVWHTTIRVDCRATLNKQRFLWPLPLKAARISAGGSSMLQGKRRLKRQQRPRNDSSHFENLVLQLRSLRVQDCQSDIL